MATNNLLEARLRFRQNRRDYCCLFIALNVVFVLGLFLSLWTHRSGWVLLGLFLLYPVIAFVILSGALLPVRFFCPTCNAYTGTHADWACDFCRFEHRRSDCWYFRIWPFSRFDRCNHCGKEQEFLKCWKCGRKTFFTEASRTSHETVQARIHPSVPEDPTKKRAREKEEIEHQIEMIKYEKELEDVRAELRKEPPASRMARLEKEFGDQLDNLAIREWIQKQRAENAEKNANNPEAKRLRDAVIDHCINKLGI